MSFTSFHSMATITNSNSHVPGEEAPSTLSLVTQTEQNLHSPALQSLLSPGTSSLKQVEMVSRLQQLMAWQERQKDSLLRQQQEEIMRIHRLHQVSDLAEQDDEEPLSARTTVHKHIPDAAATSGEPVDPSTQPVASEESEAGKRISKEVKLGGNESPDNRPIKPGIGKNLASFEELIEATLRSKEMEPSTSHNRELKRPTPKRPFLRQGQGISRFSLKEAGIKCKNKPKRKGSLLHLQSSQEGTLKSQSSPLLRDRSVSRQWKAMSPAGILAGDDNSEPRICTPMSLVRCSSEDSFIIRRDQRLELERNELQEFELLEEAANMSYSSQLSLFNDFPKHSTSRQPDQVLARDKSVHPSDSDSQRNVPVNSSTTLSRTNQSRSHQFQAVVDGEDEDASTVDLDETLKFSPSLAKGVEFNDREAWESFSHGSPQSRHRTESSSSDVTLPHSSPSTQDSYWNTPVKKEVLAKNVGFQAHHPTVHRLDTRDKNREQSVSEGRHITSAIEKCRILEAPGPTTHTQSSTPNVKDGCSLSYPPSESPNSVGSVLDGGKLFVPPAPPSALVSKLFPVLRQVEEPRKASSSHQTKLHHASDGHVPPSAESTSPVSSMGDSGIRSLSSTSMALSEDLKYKLNQLEEEIAKYRAENATLERLRKEREDGVAHLRHEISAFMKQKDEEMSGFEEYRREEIKKLKKERRIFEAYQQEATSARDKRDKEDIENLRTELLACQEDFRSGEARWGATLSRYRIRIRSLETDNSELKEDLKMMEQERLRSWQIQVEQEVLAKKKSIEHTEHTNVKAANSRTRKPKQAKNSYSDVKMSEQVERKSLSLSRKQGSLKRAPLRENLNQVSHHVNVVQVESESDTNQSDYEDSKLTGYDSDSESCVSEVAEEIVMQVIGSDTELGGAVKRSKGKVSRPKEKENIKPTKSIAMATRNPLTSHNGTNTELIQGGSQTLASDNRGVKKNRSVRFSLSSTPSPLKADTPPPRSPPKSSPKSPPKAATMPAAISRGREAGVTTHKELLQLKQAPAANKSEVIQSDGSKVITFSNGTKKIVSADGKSNSVYFFNGDIKHVKSDQTVVYYYSEFKVTQTNYPDGLEVIEFPNKQCEKHYPNGTKEIHFPNDTVKYIYPNGEEESVFPDGLSQRNFPNGNVTLHMPNGIKEYYTSDYKRREYPDGTVKTVYPDGKQETHYASGRVKIKDKNGRIITDAVTT